MVATVLVLEGKWRGFSIGLIQIRILILTRFLDFRLFLVVFVMMMMMMVVVVVMVVLVMRM